MRYRQLVNMDMTFGNGGRNFYVNEPAAPAQAILTRLRLEVGEWFLNTSDGTPYLTQIFGYGSADSRNVALRDRILGTEGVVRIDSFSSTLGVDRALKVVVAVTTAYGDLVIDLTGGDNPGGSGQLDWRIDGNILLMVVN